MRTLHVPYCYYPDPVGGTEIYVAALARAQRLRGFDPAIAAPGPANDEYVHDEARIFRFAASSRMEIDEMYGDGDRAAALNFAPVLDRFRPHVLHLHARSQAVSILLARAAKARGIPVVFTYHTPTVTCARGTMLRWGKDVCDGEMRAARCASCMVHGKGAPLPLAIAAGALPSVCGRIVGGLGLKGGFWTAIRSGELMRIRHGAVRRMLDEVDHICAVCEWVREALITNGIPQEKITLSRQGVPYSIGSPASGKTTNNGGTLRLAFFGRADAVKGLDTALATMKRITGANVSLDIFAVAQGEHAQRELERMKQDCASYTRIRFAPPVTAPEVVATLRQYDALLAPSKWMETGPLVVYEAFAAGIAVIGSDLGGIAELVTDGVNGILVPPGSEEALAGAILRLANEPGLLEKLKSGPKAVRTAEDTVRDAAMVYARVTDASAITARAEEAVV